MHDALKNANEIGDKNVNIIKLKKEKRFQDV